MRQREGGNDWEKKKIRKKRVYTELRRGYWHEDITGHVFQIYVYILLLHFSFTVEANTRPKSPRSCWRARRTWASQMHKERDRIPDILTIPSIDFRLRNKMTAAPGMGSSPSYIVMLTLLHYELWGRCDTPPPLHYANSSNISPRSNNRPHGNGHLAPRIITLHCLRIQLRHQGVLLARPREQREKEQDPRLAWMTANKCWKPDASSMIGLPEITITGERKGPW